MDNQKGGFIKVQVLGGKLSNQMRSQALQLFTSFDHRGIKHQTKVAQISKDGISFKY